MKMKMKMVLFTLAATVITMLGTITSAWACTTLANQEDCPTEFLR